MTAPAPALPTDTGQLGPGELHIGVAGSEIDVSCYVNNAVLESSADTTDATFKLCGASRPGVTTMTYTLSGNLDIDLGNDSGFFALCWDNPGSVQAFEFIPSTALGVSFTGQLVVIPLSVGADEYGADLTSDFAFETVGKPVKSGAGGVAATGATAGTPGSWTPAGSVPPANLAALQAGGITASPASAWTTGQNVVLGDSSTAHWSGSAWAAGAAA